ncbi:globin domain-containing protein [Vibrio sp. SCSIO 43136]|uniref:globin domain-containing protein n=1 Tax=Vibrio sp. SCSIO 43136 TaxID=2819101 RepID=UPI002075C10A|nr:globin domain-containing protein [Vibrio sp. SCSIO 43136]USD65889.1 hemin receptor [Vibrio sp. SCSIO 43136]
MVLTEQELQRIQANYALIEQDSAAFSQIFYQKLFALDPSLRSLFRNDIKIQGRKLMAMLELAVRDHQDMAMLVPMLHQLAERHNDYQVKKSHFKHLNTAVQAALSEYLGERLTEQDAKAWRTLFQFLADTMTPHLHH